MKSPMKWTVFVSSVGILLEVIIKGVVSEEEVVAAMTPTSLQYWDLHLELLNFVVLRISQSSAGVKIVIRREKYYNAIGPSNMIKKIFDFCAYDLIFIIMRFYYCCIYTLFLVGKKREKTKGKLCPELL